MQKWYEMGAVDSHVIISSRVRLARNLAAYPFPSKISEMYAGLAIAAMRDSVFTQKNMQNPIISALSFADLSKLDSGWLKEMSERQVISPTMVNKTTLRGLIYNEMENISIMLNEEDHLRIQVIYPEQNLDKAYETASSLDDIMSENLEYAFDTEFGYLTSCPTNTGTGMRASYMLHIPLLESIGNLKTYAELITKAGFAIRGTYGEGSEAMGGIYQISNQITLGKSEEETISALKHLANQLVDKEISLREHVAKTYAHETEDAVHRGFGILTNCRKISLNEAMKHLSEVRLGVLLGLISCEISGGTIYNLMTNIQPFNLQKIMGSATDGRHLDVLRAEYLRNSIK